MKIAQAISFLEQHGDSSVQARLAALLEAAPASPEVVDAVVAGQLDSGGWPYAGAAGNPASLHETCRVLNLLLELDEVEHPAALAGREFLRQQQSHRGFWRESQELTAFEPPLWMDPESDDATIYTTALCASTLANASDDPNDQLAIDLAVAWLQPQIAPTGLLPGFRIYATALAIPAFVAIAHPGTRSVKRMVGGLGDQLSADWDTATLGVLVSSLAAAGLPRATRVIERALAALKQLQLPDGAWPDEQGAPDGELTWQLVRAARRLGLR